MEIKNIAEARCWSEEKLQKVGIYASQRGFCDVYCFEPGQFQKMHNHENADKIYIVLEGQGRVVVDGTDYILGINDSMTVPPPLPHGVFNDSDERLVMLVFLSGDYPHQ
jgi:mannose-6-phosphate isomerase-like protein (cupin superfamily)